MKYASQGCKSLQKMSDSQSNTMKKRMNYHFVVHSFFILYRTNHFYTISPLFQVSQLMWQVIALYIFKGQKFYAAITNADSLLSLNTT
jgi:hypothetical protein